MKIAISSTGDSPQSAVDERFGRCRYFLVFEEGSGEPRVVENLARLAGGGAGVQSAQTVADSDVEIVLTGNMGPKAYDALRAAGISVVTGVSGKVEEAIERYRRGGYRASDSPTVEPHSGMR